MRIARVEADGRASFAAVEGAPGTEVAHLLGGDPFNDSPSRTGAAWALSALRLLPPVQPTKIVAVGRNYADHISEMGGQRPEAPRIFSSRPRPSSPPASPSHTRGCPVRCITKPSSRSCSATTAPTT